MEPNIYKPVGKLAVAAIAVIVATVVLYLVALLNVYVIAWVVWLFQSIF